jgi:hypothetical protein
MNDDTLAAFTATEQAAAETSYTTVLDTRATAHATNVAWSREDPPTIPEPIGRRTWRSTLALAALIVACAGLALVVIDGQILAGKWKAIEPAPNGTIVGTRTPLQPTPMPTQSATPPAPPTPSTPVETVLPTAQPPADDLTPTDHAFLNALDNDGIPQRNPGTDPEAVATAVMLCNQLQQGHTSTEVEAFMSQKYLTPAQAHAYLLDAVGFYCPHELVD